MIWIKAKNSWLPFAAFLFVFIGLLWFYFFRVGRFLEDPWYRTADADVVFAGQAITLLNGGDLTFLHHPGTVVYGIQTGVHRLVGLFNDEQRNLTRLSDPQGVINLASLFSSAVNTGRVFTIPYLVALAAAIYFLLYKITRLWWVAFIFTFYIALSKSVLRHAGIIRAEIPSILFFYLSVLLFLAARSRRRPWVIGSLFILSGLALGLAVFSKIQIITAIGLWAPLVAVILATSTPLELPDVRAKMLGLNFGLATVLILITPFWALGKPAFLTPEFYAAMDPNNQAVYGRYGAEAANFWLPVLAAELLLVGLAAAALLLRSRLPDRQARRLAASSITLNLLTLGVILSTYLVVIPISFSLAGYWNNLNQLLYSTLTNLTSGGRGFLLNSQWSFGSSTREIISLHSSYSAFAGINVVDIAAAVVVVCLFRLVRLKNQDRFQYLVPFYLILGAFAIDQVSMLRLQYAYSIIYGAFSIVPYGLGLGIFTGLELSLYPPGRKLAPALIGLVIFSVGLVNLVTASHFVLFQNSPVQEGPYTEEEAWRMIRVYLPQIEILKSYPKLSRQACVTPEQLVSGLTRLEQSSKPPFGTWNFRETSSDRFKDARTGMLGAQTFNHSSEGYPLFSAQSGGLYLNGSDISRLAENPEGIGDISASLWVRITDDPNRSGAHSRTLLFGYEDTSLDLFLVSENSRHIIVGYYAGEAVGYPLERLFRSIWYHLVLVKDGQNLRLYMNGDRAGEVTLSARQIQPSQLPGVNLWGGPETATFKLASAAVWLRALSDEEVGQIFQDTLEEKNGTHEVEDVCKPALNKREFLRAEGEARW